MAVIGSFDKTKHLSELNDPLIGGATGTLTPVQRRAAVAANLGIATADGLTALQTQAPHATATATATLTTSQLLSGVIVATPAGPVSYTLPTAAALEAALIAIQPNIQVNDSFEFTIINVSATDLAVITMVTNTGWTLFGRLTISEGDAAGLDASATFRVRRTSTTTYTLYRIA